jgi:hypothetical protein
MEDFIYIILAVVWLAISILGNKKRKAQQAQQQQQQPKTESTSQDSRQEPYVEKQPSQPSEFEVLLDDFFGEGQPTKKPEPIELKEEKEKEKHVFSDEYTFQGRKPEGYSVKEEMSASEIEKFEGSEAIDDDFEFSAEGSLETIEDLIKAYDNQNRLIQEQDSQIDVVDLDMDELEQSDLEFDGRKAIIYSEIINRKYT